MAANTRAEVMVSVSETIIGFSKALLSLVARKCVIFMTDTGGFPGWKSAEMMLLFHQCFGGELIETLQCQIESSMVCAGGAAFLQDREGLPLAQPSLLPKQEGQQDIL